MQLAYVDELAKDKNGAKYILLRQNLFDKVVDAKGNRTKESKETDRVISTMITKKSRH